MASFGFPRRARITGGAELQRIVREGKRIRTVHLEVRMTASPLARSAGEWNGLRVGLIVPRFKQSAVARNRLKRRLRELTRLHMFPRTIKADVVIKIRPEAYGASFVLLAADISRAVVQLEQWHVPVAEPDTDQAPKAADAV